ncbi:hypothetical protein [Anaerobiospirillum thomasii]|uniref:Flagellar hook-length control protein FliK n=1 Tax=Anaerobiospirillum thomasii TaxID=179995 RepID=A0A2X0V6R1_9GAMM|nr:hypothetical protein [Anaerobiospirillum thomasii]SPT69553.1 Uncharacterised protein [Anaerobiospirillum thomasii]
MDQIDINARKAASEMQKNAVSGKAKSEKVVKSPAINIHATASYIKALQTSQDNLPESLNKGLNTLKNNLSIYLNAPDKIEDVPVDSTRESMSTFNKLSLQVISRDSALQEKVAQNLSTSKRLVRARDAQKSLEQSLNSMPQALKEGTGVGRSLSKFVCECLVNLTDPQTIGAGLERDLAMRQIFIPQDRLNSRSASAVSKSLEQSIAFIESNQKDVIARLPKNEYVQEKPGATTPQTMTRYLRKALDEFPDDSTYLDIFKQNRDRTDNAPYDDKVSEEISSRIHSLIAKAAQTARRGNLIPNSRKNAESTPVPTEQVRAQERTFNRPIQSDAPIDENVSARELSLSELSARAARLQKQFRQERMRLVQEGKLPNPATPPESFTVNTTAKEVLSKTLSEPGPAEKLQTARDLALQRAIVDTSAKAPNVADDMATDIKNTVSAQKPAVTADEAHVSTPSEQAKAVAEKTLMQQGTMLDKGVKISYTAAQNNLYGAINMAPGETIAIQTPSLETPAVKGPVEPQSTVEPTKQEPLSPKSLVDEITAQLKKQLADDIVKTIEMKTSNLSEKLDDIKATAEELKNKAQNQESKLTSLEKGLIENSAAIDEAKKQAEEISKEQAKALHDIQSKALEAKQNASVSLQSTADYGRYNFTTSQNTSSILEQKLYSGVNTASTPVHNEEALEPEQNVNTTKPAPQPTDEIYEDQTQEVKPQNKVPVQTTDDTVETDAEEIKPQNKVPVQTADEPADIEAEEVKPQNKVPVQTTDDTVETDAEEIKPQNKVPVQTADEPADIEAEEVKPQNKVPVQTTDDTVETDAEEIKPQNKVPVQTADEPADIEAEEVKPQNKVPVQTTDDTVETDAEEIKPQNKVPVQTADEPADIEAEEVKPQNKVPVQATDDTVETDAEEIKPQNKVPVQTADEPADIEAEEVKPQNKVPVQATDDTVETDAEEIKPQNKVPVQTAEEPAEVEAEEVKPQNKVPVQATDDTVETDAEEIKPQNKVPVQTTEEPAEVEAEEVKPQNKAPVQTSEEPVEVEAEEVKPQNKAPVQTSEEPVEVETEEVKPQNKAPVQATDDTVETDAEEIKPQNKVPVQTADEPADVEAEEVKPQNKVPVQATDDTVETDAEEIKPQNKAPVQTSEEPVEVEAEEVKPQNKAPVQTTEEPVEVETEEVKPQISTPIQNADELDADDLNGKFAINNDFVDRDIDYDNISTAMPNAQALNSTLITDLENAQGADADNISKLYQYVKPEATDLDLFESQPNKGQSGTAQSTDDGSESVNKPSDIISKVLSQTVPSDDFNDEHNVTLQAIKSEKDIIADITAKSPSIENAEIDDKLNISGRKEAVLNNLVTPPGASVVTTGNSNPIPEQTHIDSMQPVKEGGFFKRIMARFKSGRADEIKDNTAEIKTDNSISTPTVTGKDGQYVLKANPLDQMMYTLRLQSGNPNLPPEFKEEAQKLLNALNNPVDDLISVKNWLNFVTGPISPNSSQALAMHQWAFYILCLRYQQLGKDVHKFLKKSMSSQDIASLMQSLPAIKKDKVLEGPSISMLEETFGQIERLQQQNSNNNNINPLLNRYIPLPPNYDGGREGGFTLKKEKDEDGENTWHLNFAFELKDLGPIEIKAVAKLPEIKLSFVTENLHAMQKVQELMPDLNYNLQCIGITARTSSMRLGRVSLKESTIAKNPQAPRNDGSTVSVDI